MLKPTTNNILIKEIKERTTASGFVIPPQEGETQKGEVLESNNIEYPKGLIVYFKKWNALEIKEGGETYLVVPQEDIKAILSSANSQPVAE